MLHDSKDYYRTANLLIKQHGNLAEAEAEKLMQVFIEADDPKGAAVWLNVMQALKDLRATQEGATLN